MRFLMGLGVEIEIHPPHRPDKNGYVERLNRTYKEEAIQIYRPQTLPQVEQMNRDFGHLKGLFNGLLPFRTYLALIQQEALSEWQCYRWPKRRYTALG